MKIASWNVNSLNVRLPQVLQWLKQAQPDLLGLQETKLTDDRFPCAELEEAGYKAIFSGQKTYNGVAILSRSGSEPSEVIRDLPGWEDPQRRVIAATYGAVRMINLYVPNGSEVGSEKFDYKLRWLETLREFLRAELKAHKKLAVVGDFNIAPEPGDVYDPELWEGSVLFSEPERNAFKALLELGLSDSFRLFDQEPETYSWWDYRAAAFRRNLGLRIDHVLVSEALAGKCTSSGIDREPRRWDRPSDHAPAIAEFDL